MFGKPDTPAYVPPPNPATMASSSAGTAGSIAARSPAYGVGSTIATSPTGLPGDGGIAKVKVTTGS